MKKIRINSPKYGTHWALVDDEDYEYLSQFTWCLKNHGSVKYAFTNLRINGKKAVRRMHKFLIEGKIIDHINHNGLDNRRSNLRVATGSQNSQNRRKALGCSSIYIGVCYDKQYKKWRASCRENFKNKFLGLFSSEIAAARAYDIAVLRIFGPLAKTNKLT